METYPGVFIDDVYQLGYDEHLVPKDLKYVDLKFYASPSIYSYAKIDLYHYNGSGQKITESFTYNLTGTSSGDILYSVRLFDHVEVPTFDSNEVEIIEISIEYTLHSIDSAVSDQHVTVSDNLYMYNINYVDGQYPGLYYYDNYQPKDVIVPSSLFDNIYFKFTAFPISWESVTCKYWTDLDSTIRTITTIDIPYPSLSGTQITTKQEELPLFQGVYPGFNLDVVLPANASKTTTLYFEITVNYRDGTTENFLSHSNPSVLENPRFTSNIKIYKDGEYKTGGTFIRHNNKWIPSKGVYVYKNGQWKKQ